MVVASDVMYLAMDLMSVIPVLCDLVFFGSLTVALKSIPGSSLRRDVILSLGWSLRNLLMRAAPFGAFGLPPESYHIMNLLTVTFALVLFAGGVHSLLIGTMHLLCAISTYYHYLIVDGQVIDTSEISWYFGNAALMQFVFVFTEFRGAQAGVPLFFAEKVLKHAQGSQKAIREDAGPHLPFDHVNSMGDTQSDPGCPSRRTSKDATVAGSSSYNLAGFRSEGSAHYSTERTESNSEESDESQIVPMRRVRRATAPAAPTEGSPKREAASEARFKKGLRGTLKVESEISLDLSLSMCTGGVGTGVLADAGVQTVSMSSAEVGVQVGAARPPRIPSSLAPQRGRATVTLRTTRLVRKEFQETPNATVQQLLLAILSQINPRGKGCCFWHVGLRVLQECLSPLTIRPCDRALQPYTGWQCMNCFALNEAETEFEDRMCSACEMPELLVAEHDVEEEESPSCEADVESSVAATDAESVQDAE